MRMQRRSYGSRGGSRGGGIDWKRTIVWCACFMLAISALQFFFSAIGLGGGILLLCLAIVGWHFLPRIIRNMKIQHLTKTAQKRDPIDRTELLDLDE